MYCVIQRIMNKEIDSCGTAKELKVTSITWTIDGKTQTKYSHTHGDEYFQRTHREAYKISIHKSYRENGNVKKSQWVICTIGYYDIIDWGTWVGDYTVGLNGKLKKIGITENELSDMVYKKFDSIIEAVKAEFEKTPEYKAKQEQKKIIDKYNKAKDKFEKKYGSDTYDYCYDVFGVLRNETYLKELQSNYEAQQQYYKNYHSSYYGNDGSNYGDNKYSSYFESGQDNYTDEEKQGLKKIYKVLALKFHPDMPDGDAEIMKLVNKLKENWQI